MNKDALVEYANDLRDEMEVLFESGIAYDFQLYAARIAFNFAVDKGEIPPHIRHKLDAIVDTSKRGAVTGAFKKFIKRIEQLERKEGLKC